MVTLSQAQIVGIVSLALILSGTVAVEVLEKSYYCPTEDNVKECLRLSSSGLTCYYLTAPDVTKGDRCTGGIWEPLDSYLNSQTDTPQSIQTAGSVKITANAKVWNCVPDNGFVSAYTFCRSGESEGYLGELI